tara:strand:- start:49 stop:459 length:411 start_codon:yes stop_codon:yes gene_type:complete
MADTPRTTLISEDVERIMAEDEAKKKAAAAEAAKPNPTGTRDVTDTEIGKLLGDSTQRIRDAENKLVNRQQMQEKVDRASDRMRSAQEQINRQQAQGRVKRATENMQSAQEMIDAMKKAERRSFGQLEKIEPPKKK